jgi:hypothetical protein
VAPRLLDLLKDADDAAPPEFIEQRRQRAAFAAEFEATSRDIQKLFCDLLVFEGFTKPLGYESNRQVTEGGIVAQVRAWADAADLSVALGAEVYLPREPGPVVVRDVRAGVQRTSTKQSAELPIDIHESPEGAALHRDEVYAAFTSLIAEVSLATEAARAREIKLPLEQPPNAYWDAIDALEGRVTALEAGVIKPGKKKTS